MTDDEFRALVEAGPCVVMVAKSDMLRLLDEVAALRQSVERARGEALEEAAGWHDEQAELRWQRCREYGHGTIERQQNREVARAHEDYAAAIRARAGGAGDE
jgi:hypothetical protein